MYRKIENAPYMTRNEASVRYPDCYILMQRDNRDMFNGTGNVLYVGDDGDELFILQITLPVHNGVVIEGEMIQCNLGGIVVGG